MYDIHVHTEFSHDSSCSLKEYAKLIDDGIIEGIGFAEHVDYTPDGSGYGIFDYKKYYSSVMEYKNKGYQFYAGGEVGFLLESKEEILECLSEEKYDFTICSVHRSMGYSLSTNRNIETFRDNEIFRSVIENYYNSVRVSAGIKEFDVIGHLGIYYRYLDGEFFKNNPIKNVINECENEIARVLAKTDKIVEINTSGFFSPSKSTFPNISFLKWYKENGGKRICLSSDAHNWDKVGRGFEEAGNMLKSIGFNYYVLPWQKDKFLVL